MGSKAPECGKYRGIEGGKRILIFCTDCDRYMGEVRPFWDRFISERRCEECSRESEETDIDILLHPIELHTTAAFFIYLCDNTI